MAEEAIKSVGTYFSRYRPRPSEKITRLLEESARLPLIRGRMGRFQVMALLQAARYYILHNDLDKAKSFGLNRAIFYAWAKYYRPLYKRSRRRRGGGREVGREAAESYVEVGGEKAYISSEGWFTIGGDIQKPEDFDREIKSKIEKVVGFNTAWEVALDYIRKFPVETLMDRRRFYEDIYKLVRDDFIKIIQEYISMHGVDKK